MKNEAHVLKTEHQIAEAQTQLTQRSSDKVESNEIYESYQRKSSPRHVQPKIETHHFQRMADGNLLCTHCSRTLPLTSKGDLDKVELLRKIALRQW